MCSSGLICGADKGYDTKVFVAEMHRIAVTPHVAQTTVRPQGLLEVILRARGCREPSPSQQPEQALDVMSQGCDPLGD